MGVIANLLIDELASKGYYFEDVTDLKNRSHNLPVEATSIILKWLPKVYDEHLGAGDCVVRSLFGAGEPYDPTVLIDLFEKSNHNETIKSAIAYVLSVTNTYNITPWLKNQLYAEPHSFGRAGLLSGIVTKGGFKSKVELREFLREIFDKYAYYEELQKLFQKYGSVEDVPFLETKATTIENKRTAREVLKVAEKIKNRKRDAKFP